MNSKSYKAVKISELFEIHRGKIGALNSLEYGKIPLISSSENNMGVAGYYDIPSKYINMLTISLNGACGFCAYHGYYFNINSDCAVLVPKIKCYNEHILKFFAIIINNTKGKFAYGYKSTPERLHNTYILVPVNSNLEIDFKFMEEYIKEREYKLKEQYKQHIQQRINKLSEKITEKREWKEYPISKIFDIKAGKRLTKANMIEGNIPFIGSTDSNNGITNFVKNENASTDKNVLGVNYNGSVVENFYHPYKCTFSDDVKRFTTKEVLGNKYLYLFLKNSILKQKCKYMYGYKFNENRMKKQRITLPINESGEPDYEYMENHMKYLEQKKLLEYLDYIK